MCSPHYPKDARSADVTPHVAPQGSVQEGRGQLEVPPTSCTSDNVGLTGMSGARAPENSDADSAVLVQRWIRRGGKDPVDAYTLELMCKLEQ